MAPQHPKIAGYRDLTQDEVELVNEIKTQGNALGDAIDAVGQLPQFAARALAIAKTHLQTGLMWLVRSITRPGGF